MPRGGLACTSSALHKQGRGGSGLVEAPTMLLPLNSGEVLQMLGLFRA